MFSNPTPISQHQVEGTIAAIDTIRLSVNVITQTGQQLYGVPLPASSGGSTRGGDVSTPHVGDRVIVDTSLGHPTISRFLPKLQTADTAFPVVINSGETIIDTGNFTTATAGNAVPNQNKPQDLLQGDRVFSSFGGSLVAILRGGSVLIKGSPLSSIFVSKINDLVKVVSRNWFHYTDVASDAMRNVAGRIFRVTGYTNTYSNSQSENYQYYEYRGDTVAAESLKTGSGTPGTMNTIIAKNQVVNSGASEIYRHTVDTTANEETHSTNGAAYTTLDQQPALWQATYNGVNTITINPTEIVVVFNNQNSITLNATSIVATINGGNTITMTSSEIQLSETSGGVTTLNSTGITNTFNGHFMNITSAGVQLG